MFSPLDKCLFTERPMDVNNTWSCYLGRQIVVLFLANGVAA